MKRLLLAVALIFTVSISTLSWAEDAQPTLASVTQRLESGAEPVRIVCFGDSITGVYYHSGSQRAWCDMLGLALNKAYPDAQIEMINAGISGNTSAAGLVRIERDVIARQPHLVVVMFGMNDVVGTKPDVFAKNLATIVTRCHDAGAAVVLCTPNSVIENTARPNAGLSDLAQRVKIIAAEFDLTVVDVFTAWQQARERDADEWSLWMSDEIHPNMNGHIRFAELMATEIAGVEVTLGPVEPPQDALHVTFGRLSTGEPITLVAASPYDRIMPAVLSKIFPDAEINVTSWPVAAKSLAEISTWAKQIRGLSPHLVVPAVPASASSDTRAAYLHDYEWALNFCFPFGGRGWDVVPILPNVTLPDVTAPIAGVDAERFALARRLVVGKDVQFIERTADDARAADAVVADWIAARYRDWQMSRTYGVRLRVTTPLEYDNVPLDPTIDFAALITAAKIGGVLDPNSIEVINTADGQSVACAVSEDFAYGDRGRVEWVVADRRDTEYEIRFRLAEHRPPLVPRAYTPWIGTGDLLRYNAEEPRPLTLTGGATLADLTGDGHNDLVGCWNYAYRPGDPWNGIICYPRIDTRAGETLFGDLRRVRYIDSNESDSPKHFQHTYMAAAFADFNGDDLDDLVYTRKGVATATIYLNSGRRDAGGTCLFTPTVDVAVAGWQSIRAVDLDRDGAVDLFVGGQWIRNENPDGWPFQAAEPVALAAGREPCFFDVDGDGRLDAVCLAGGETPQPDGYRIAWRGNQGGEPPTFGQQQLLTGIDAEWCSSVSSVRDGDRDMLLVQHDVYQQVTLFELADQDDGAETPQLRRRARAESLSAVMSLSDQAWPRLCDWDGDGDQDLLVGGGYGWPRIVINTGSTRRPVFAEPRLILSDGEPIRFLRDDILGEPHHWHNMGYPYPDYVDWDVDGLPDLICPNETNRIFWYKNVGTRAEPAFGPRQQVLVDGYAESPAARRESAELALEATYPLEESQPFFWRTAAAFADFNGDALPDLVTHDGHTRRATLFARYRDDEGVLRLRKERPLELVDGRTINDAIVGRTAHWTEGFRAVDWDGDDLIDLVYSLAGAHHGMQDNGSIYVLHNRGTATDPVFAAPETLSCFGEPIRITNHGPNAWPGDFDGDGRPDLVTCVEWSVYPTYRHAALMMPTRPEYILGDVYMRDPSQNE